MSSRVFRHGGSPHPLLRNSRCVRRVLRSEYDFIGSLGYFKIPVIYTVISFEMIKFRFNLGYIFQNWKKTFYKASTALQGREQKLEEAAQIIERDLTLLGASAIEDKLQDQVA